MNVKIKKLRCGKCGHEWTPRKESVVQCPKCKSARWNECPECQCDMQHCNCNNPDR